MAFQCCHQVINSDYFATAPKIGICVSSKVNIIKHLPRDLQQVANCYELRHAPF
jgi:hypothetical protein